MKMEKGRLREKAEESTGKERVRKGKKSKKVQYS